MLFTRLITPLRGISRWDHEIKRPMPDDAGLVVAWRENKRELLLMNCSSNHLITLLPA